MIQQLIAQLVAAGATQEQAAARVLACDPMDLILYMEQVLDAYDPARPVGVGTARRSFIALGEFFGSAPAVGLFPPWDHYGYSFALENTRVVQIMRRVVREYRSGERLGIPSPDTRRWLDTTEALLFGAHNLFASWLSTSAVRPDPEAVRRNAYWRLFGMDLAFGTDDQRPFQYDKATTANSMFVPLFEELLYELWQAIANLLNTSGVNTADNDRIFRISQQLAFVLNSRRLGRLLLREELAAAAALGWLDLTLSANSPVVIDLRADATSAADRLMVIGERVGLAQHSKAKQFFSMAPALSVLLRTIESGAISGPVEAEILYQTVPPQIGELSRRVITEWAAATGKDLKVRANAVVTRPTADRALVRTR